LPLEVGEFVADSARRQVPRRPKAKDHLAGGGLDLGPRQPNLLHQLGHHQRPPVPVLDEAAAVEDSGDEWVPRPRRVRLHQVLRTLAEWQRVGTGDLQPIVI
jgi:hypothetical protein